MAKKLIFKIASIVLVVAILILTPTVIIPSIRNQNFEAKTEQYKGVINVWHIDAFEGGFGSRATWLTNRAVEFEKTQQSVYILVKNITIAELEISLSKNEKPDIISFSPVVGSMIKELADEYCGLYNARDVFIDSGSDGDSLLAVPWCMGGYCLIGVDKLITSTQKLQKDFLLENCFSLGGKNNNSFIYGNALYNNPLEVLIQNGAKRGSKNNIIDSNNINIDQQAAYDKFMSHSSATVLLGTQRDIIKSQNKYQLNKCGEMVYNALGKWTDLVQYFSVIKGQESLKKSMCEKYIEYITSSPVQKKLSGIGMFSVTGEKIYSMVGLAELEDCLNAKIGTVNAFLTPEKIQNDRKQNISKFFI